ncbi:MAG: Gfo/Idh/MocA family protein [Candidatus Ratteibacteria bacterium]
MEPVRFGVIGIADVELGYPDVIYNTPNAKLIAVCDIRKDLVEGCKEKYKVDGYLDYKEMLKREDIEAVYIALPHYLHFPVSIEALSRGKHVLVEKPIARTVKEAYQMIEIAKTKNLFLAVGFQARGLKFHSKVKEILEKDEIGFPIRFILEDVKFRTNKYFSKSWRGSWELSGGGCVINQMVHYFDLIYWYFGKPSYVYGKIRNLFHNVSIDTMVNGIIGFENGTEGVVSLSITDCPHSFFLEIRGTKGNIIQKVNLCQDNPNREIKRTEILKFLNPIYEWIRNCDKGMKEVPYIRNVYEQEDVEFKNRDVLLEKFIKAIRGIDKPLVSGEEAIYSLEISNAFVLSSIKNKPVEIPVDREEYDEVLNKLVKGEIKILGIKKGI